MSYLIDTTWVECRTCGTPVAIASKIWNNLAANGGMFRCPLGHDIRPSAPTEITKLQEEMASVQERLEWQRSLSESRAREIDWFKRSNAALRGCIKRLKKSAPRNPAATKKEKTDEDR